MRKRVSIDSLLEELGYSGLREAIDQIVENVDCLDPDLHSSDEELILFFKSRGRKFNQRAKWTARLIGVILSILIGFGIGARVDWSEYFQVDHSAPHQTTDQAGHFEQ